MDIIYMVSTTIIELSKSNDCSNNSQNSVFNITLQEPVTINNGDVVSINKSLIDSDEQQLGLIYLATDTNISMEWLYYDVCSFSIDDLEAGDTSSNNVPFKWNYFAPLTYVKLSPQSQVVYDVDCYKTNQTPVPPGNENNMKAPDGQFYFLCELQYDANADTCSLKLQKGTKSFTIKAGFYDPDSLAQILTQNMLNIAEFNNVDQLNIDSFLKSTEFNEETVMYKIGQIFPDKFLSPNGEGIVDKTLYRYFVSTNGTPDYSQATMYVGSSQAAVDFGLAVANKFQFTALHSPVFNNTGNQPVMSVKYNNVQDLNQNNKPNISTVDRSGGIAFTKLQPTSFWENLGFNLNNILVPLDPNNPDALDVPKVTNDFMMNCTTRNFASFQSFVPTGVRVLNTASGTGFYVQSDSAVPIVAQSYKQGESSYYLLQIDGLNHNKYYDGQEWRNNIQSVISKQYNNNSMVTSYSSDAVPYVHQGMPYQLANLKVSILDPLTKQPVQNLGENNSIFIQIDRN